MRDPKRIYDFCNKLANLWATNAPDLRFGQFVLNVFEYCSVDPFYCEEEEMMKLFEQLYWASGGGKENAVD